MNECLNYEKIDPRGFTLKCSTCSHFCQIPLEKTGVCGVRMNEEGKLFLLNYGKAVALNVDPVEKKPLFHFLPGSKTYSLGALGCNLRCGNCQNYTISQIYGYKGRLEEYGHIEWGADAMPTEIVKNAAEHNCSSISYTYTEPTIFLEYALNVMKPAKEAGLKNIWVSNGFMSGETLDFIVPCLDAINIDLKSMDPDFYLNECGAKLEPILENLKRLTKENVWVEVTTLIIPGMTDDKKMLTEIAHFIKKELGDFVPWHLSAFSGAISWKLQDVPDTPLETIQAAYKIGKEAGLKYVYAGNVSAPEMENTYCAKCQSLIIRRKGFTIERNDLQGACPKCQTKIDGIFS